MNIETYYLVRWRKELAKKKATEALRTLNTEMERQIKEGKIPEPVYGKNT